MMMYEEVKNKKLSLFHSNYSQNLSSLNLLLCALVSGIPIKYCMTLCKLKIVYMVLVGNFEVMSDVVQILEISTKGNYAYRYISIHFTIINAISNSGSIDGSM
jgi:hypothetical protein